MNAMYEVLLIRHGETDYVARQLLQGHTDVPLNEAGRAQASALQSRLALLRERNPAIISSDLTRAVVTAELAWPWSPPQVDARLRELNFGEFEGRTLADIRESFGAIYSDWLNAPALHRPPGGETVAEMRARLLEWLTTLQQGTTIVFAHGGVLRALISWARGVMMDWSLSIPPTAAVWLRLAHDYKPIGDIEWFHPLEQSS
jgi:broad specificity phosphatase PhoE